MSRYTGASVEKPSITDGFRCFLARVARRRGRLLGPLWADPAEILRGKRARVWLQMMQISLGHVEVHGSSGQKTGKIFSQTDDFCRFWLGLSSVFDGFSTAAPAYLDMPQQNLHHP